MNYTITTFKEETSLSIIQELESLELKFNVMQGDPNSSITLNETWFHSKIVVKEASFAFLKQLADRHGEGIRIEEKPKLRFPIKRTLLVVYAFIMSVMFLWNWLIVREVSESKNFTYSWNAATTIQSVYSKKDKKLAAKYYDRNFDTNYEKTVEYGMKFPLIQIFYDWDEDGFFDSLIFETKNGNLVEAYYDRNQDNYFDEYILILEGARDTLLFLDQNRNGYWELQN